MRGRPPEDLDLLGPEVILRYEQRLAERAAKRLGGVALLASLGLGLWAAWEAISYFQWNGNKTATQYELKKIITHFAEWHFVILPLITSAFSVARFFNRIQNLLQEKIIEHWISIPDISEDFYIKFTRKNIAIIVNLIAITQGKSACLFCLFFLPSILSVTIIQSVTHDIPVFCILSLLYSIVSFILCGVATLAFWIICSKVAGIILQLTTPLSHKETNFMLFSGNSDELKIESGNEVFFNSQNLRGNSIGKKLFLIVFDILKFILFALSFFLIFTSMIVVPFSILVIFHKTFGAKIYLISCFFILSTAVALIILLAPLKSKSTRRPERSHYTR